MTPEYTAAWLSDDGNRRKWSEVVNTPIFQTVYSIMQARGIPKPTLITAPADAALTHNALEHARLTGYQQALTELVNLVNKREVVQYQEQEPFLAAAEAELEARGLKPKDLVP